MYCRPGAEKEDALGGSAELRADLRPVFGWRYSTPLSLSGSVMSHKGEQLAAVSAGMQGQWDSHKAVMGKLQVNNRGVASMNVQVRAARDTWLGLVGLVPLVTLVWEKVSGWRGRGQQQQQQQAQGQYHAQQQRQRADGEEEEEEDEE